ncbi:MAG: hypothetical protein NC204_06515 [Candidatus Amulumruptor caecigallinarius]|nr:hypothetical protein [Candidatus Amulumruptor caecigallinarius]
MNMHISPRFSDGRPLVLMRADASRQVGFGHFVRTAALAGYLAGDFDCRIATFNADGGHISDYQRDLVRQAGAMLVDISAASQVEFDRKFLRLSHSVPLVVLDNYYYTSEYQAAVKRAAGKLVCIDDVHDRHFVSDVVMTFCPLRREDFSLEPETLFYGGLEWSFLRDSFLLGVPPRRQWPVRRIVTAMGGADPFRLTDKILRVVRSVAPDVGVDVVAGPTVEVSETTDAGCSGAAGEIRVWRSLDASQMSSLLDSADLGIFPASTVCVEAFSRRLPVAAGHYVGNQKEFFEHGVCNNWFYPLGSFLDSEAALGRRLSAMLSLPAPPCAPQIDFVKRRADIIEIFKTLVRNGE